MISFVKWKQTQTFGLKKKMHVAAEKLSEGQTMTVPDQTTALMTGLFIALVSHEKVTYLGKLDTI